MGEAGRLRQAIFCCAAEGDFNCIFQQTLVANRNKKRPDISASSNYCADSLVLRIAYSVLRILLRAFFVL